MLIKLTDGDRKKRQLRNFGEFQRNFSEIYSTLIRNFDDEKNVRNLHGNF